MFIAIITTTCEQIRDCVIKREMENGGGELCLNFEEGDLVRDALSISLLL